MSLFTTIRSVDTEGNQEVKSVKVQCSLCWAKLDVTKEEKTCKCNYRFSYDSNMDDYYVIAPPKPPVATRFNFTDGSMVTVKFCPFCGLALDDRGNCRDHAPSGQLWELIGQSVNNE